MAGSLVRRCATRLGAPALGTPSEVTVLANRQVRLLAVSLVVLSGPSLAVSMVTQPPAVSDSPPPWADDYAAAMSGVADTYNDRIGTVSGGTVWGVDLSRAKRALRDERVNVYVVGDQGTAAYSFRFDQTAAVRDVQTGTRADATVRLVITKRAIDRIDAEYTETRAIRAAYLDGEISITGLGVGGWLRWWLIDRELHAALSD